MKNKLFAFLTLALLLTLNFSTLFAQGSAFTYQGRLNNNGAAANGSYDLQFAVFDTAAGGSQIGSALTTNAVALSNGLFTVTLDFGAGVFTGADRWLNLSVKTNGAGSFTPLTPRQPITATPYAITAGNLNGALASASLGGTYANALTLNNAANSFSGNGSNLTALNASQLASGTVPAAALSNAWRIGGNAGTTPATHFLGTADNQPLELKVKNQRALRLEPTASTDTVNVIGGSARNSVGATTVGATIGGGGSGDYGGSAYTNRVEASFGTVSGGAQNTIQPNSYFASIGGGAGNTIQTIAAFATISAGAQNTIQTGAQYATIAGGNNNTIQTNAFYATIGGGIQNRIQTDARFSTIGGGVQNTIQPNGEYATIPGGLENSATNYAFAAGTFARANHTGAFVWADSTLAEFASTAANQFLIRAAGGVGINTNNPNGAALAVNGAVTATSDVTEGFKVSGGQAGYELQDRVVAGVPGRWVMFAAAGSLSFHGAGSTRMRLDSGGNLFTGGAVNPPSDRNAKENFRPVDPRAVLAKVAALPLSEWNYKTDTATRHVGPMAQDFRAAFGLGTDDKHIATVDADGVALAAIQGLNEKVESGKQKAETQIQELKAENAELKQRLEKLERLMNRENGGAE